MYSTVPCIKYDDGAMVPSSHDVVMEAPLAVFVNGRHALTAMISPAMLEEFVTGFLYTEKIIRKPEDIESLRIEEKINEKGAGTMSASVLTKDPFSIMLSGKTVLSGCGGDASYLDADRLPKIQSDMVIDVSTIKDIMKETLVSDLHTRTGGIHIVGLFGPDRKICVMEDIGRHNALDKAIGYGLKHGVDFSQTIVACSGRLSSEMARKCLMANIPVIVSRGATTTLAISMGERAGLTIIGFVRSHKMNIYTGTERIKNQELS
ncbi:formate dehydrogenase [Methanosarcina sp. 2.H.T.1A.6]|uniref:formate dehydrogenase accessory sulfurtransferase FdhD n=1 Tax=unclassified Methanosarcina TaxID=2644672 RepID=UPI000622A6FF|nr:MULTISPECIES: formate dehydrogenase accessory sulfurtransferase FdhD [unclassified Methanosarcina]KKG18165.1 formate dehydrogenase [Methanosarcina sp. 2.H.T.1A.3]KKG19072.1 formate dehydrogenase [Methanosarcina sp. 2.H.T.1A.15]KKG19388.1 formate dehydrogenase [Methanosarcina sp. 2.H.T.1A.6]KKG25570.1 formate dehydrogenase [Methanosarcina sp. 2.H.T.1A.8]